MKYDFTVFEGCFLAVLILSSWFTVYLGHHTATAVYLSAIFLSGLIVRRLPQPKED